MAQAPTFNFAGIPDAKAAGTGTPASTDGGLNFDGIPEGKPATPAKPKKSWRQQTNENNEAALREGVGGVVRGAVSTVQGLATPIRKAFGMAPATPPRAETTAVGKTARGMEQVGEFAVPGAVAGKLESTAAKVATAAAGNYAVARGQGSDQTGAGLAAGAGAVGEGLTALPTAKIVNSLKTTAGKKLATFFGSAPTDAPAVRRAIADIVPTALSEGIPATWKSWLWQTEADKLAKGAAVKSTVAGSAGDAWAPVKPVIEALKGLEESAKVTLGEGGHTGAIKDPDLLRQTRFFRTQMEKLEAAGSQGRVPARALHDVKQTWNAFSKFDPSKFTEAKDLILAAKVRAARTATDAIREVLASASPDIAQVDKAYHLSHGVHDAVVEAALNARGNVAPGIVNALRRSVTSGSATGAGVGATANYQRTHSLTGAVEGAVVGGITGRFLEQAMASPAWKTKGPQFYNAVANAITSGDAARLRQLVMPVIAAGTSAVGKPKPVQPATAPPPAAPVQ